MSSSESKMDFFDVGDKTALVCADPGLGESVRGSLRDLGFKFHTAETPELAIDRIRYTQYDVLILQENFAGGSLKSNAMLNYLAPLSMSQRRYTMTVLIGSSVKTLDAMEAFGLSVHVLVNTSDLPNLTAILRKSKNEFDSQYKVYKDVFASLGEK